MIHNTINLQSYNVVILGSSLLGCRVAFAWHIVGRESAEFRDDGTDLVGIGVEPRHRYPNGLLSPLLGRWSQESFYN